MATTNKIIVCGDVHGGWWDLNRLINKKNPLAILQCGDMGYWPTCDGSTEIGRAKFDTQKMKYVVKKPWALKGIKNHDTSVHWCDGNHEDHWRLREAEKNMEYDCLGPGTRYQPRGSTLQLPDGRVVMFFGGAESIDGDQRVVGVDYFPIEEVITQREVMNLPECHVDIVISHTCPEEFIEGLEYNHWKLRDPSCKALSYVLEHYKPSRWYFGHWHQYKHGWYNGCHWTCLNMANDNGWWEYLK